LRKTSQNEEEANHMVSLAQLQEVPPKSMILLVGAPGSGKSTFCQQVALQSLAMDRPIIFVVTEYGPSEAERSLRERGLGEVELGLLNFVDAYNETVGVTVSDRADTMLADCNSLSSIDIAISKLTEKIGRKGILLVVDSLTSPYLFCGSEILRFIRQTLSRFAARNNAVLVCMDEGCGKPEDLVAMMTLCNGVIKMELSEGKKVLTVIKHPRIEPKKIELPVTTGPPSVISYHFERDYLKHELELFMRGANVVLRKDVGDFVNIAWRDLILWSGVLWDPKRFPTMMYELTKYSEGPTAFNQMSSLVPWRMKFFLKFMPKSFSKVKDMRKMMKTMFTRFRPEEFKMGIFEYLEGLSKTDEHYLKVQESYECWGLENIGTSLGFMRPALIAGVLEGFESWRGLERDWNAVETKCIGLGDPYCEFKLVPGEITELNASLEKDSSVIERMHDRLIEHILGFMLHRKPLVKRPTLGNGVHIHEVQHVAVAPIVNERLQMVFRMGGARVGKMLGERLIEAGLKEEEAVKRVVDLMEHCKVGKVTFGETIRMRENCERFGVKTEQPSCYFTTGFLNGFFSIVKNNHVKVTKCIALGDPYCEWEFR
jgi:predicted hydrocarbon binding protein/KaiC/GvpD/RAD55 family RecA-like ATPase